MQRITTRHRLSGRRIGVLTLLAGLTLALAPALASAQEATVQWADNEEFGQILVAADGMTLYTFDNDEPGVSNCAGDCLANWPPLTVAEGDTPTAGEGVEGALDVIEREDTGEFQVTLDGQPLYFWVGDEAPGDTTGHGVGGVWWVISQEVEEMAPPEDEEDEAPPEEEAVEEEDDEEVPPEEEEAVEDDDVVEEDDAVEDDEEVTEPAVAGTAGLLSGDSGALTALAVLLAIGVLAVAIGARRLTAGSR